MSVLHGVCHSAHTNNRLRRGLTSRMDFVYVLIRQQYTHGHIIILYIHSSRQTWRFELIKIVRLRLSVRTIRIMNVWRTFNWKKLLRTQSAPQWFMNIAVLSCTYNIKTFLVYFFSCSNKDNNKAALAKNCVGIILRIYFLIFIIYVNIFNNFKYFSSFSFFFIFFSFVCVNSSLLLYMI